ncbi:MAG: TIGR01777 family oxidoreductase [Microbacteriaceae bacterium]
MAAQASRRILVSGASGLVGTELCAQLQAAGHTVVKLVRRESRTATESSWSPSTGGIDMAVVDSVDAVINLSGASTGRLPWTTAYKKLILSSRLETTGTLAAAIARAEKPPTSFLSASAVGFYGSRPGETLDEDSAQGEGFLAEVVADWEAAASPASAASRVVTFRTGLVVGRGGAFTPLGLATRWGLGARVGSGAQFWPWVSIVDEAAAIGHLVSSKLTGVVNIVGPTPATSVEVTRALASAMHRWHAFAIPETIIRVGMREPGRELLLADQKVVPQRLLADGFEFSHPTVTSAMEAIWGSTRTAA